MTITVHDARTGENLDARVVSRELARRDDTSADRAPRQPGWVPEKPRRHHPTSVAEPLCLTVIAERSSGGKKAYPGDDWRDVARWGWAQDTSRWAELHRMAAEFRQWVDSLPDGPPEWAELPPAEDDAEQQAKFDDWHEQENSHPGLAQTVERRSRRPAPVQTAPEGPQPRDLLRADTRAWWDAVRQWRPWRRGER